MKFQAAVRYGVEECDPEAASPVAEKIGQRRGLVVLIRLELRISDHGERNKEECVAKPLQGACPCVVAIVCREIEMAVMEKRDADNQQCDKEHVTGVDEAALQELRSERCEQSDHERAGTEHQPGVDGTIPVKRLENLRNHGC